MTKQEFIKSFMEDTGFGIDDARKITEIVFNHVKEMLLQGKEVRIDGVGSFNFKYRDARTVVNNITKDRHDVGPTVKLKFRPYPSMNRSLKRELLED